MSILKKITYWLFFVVLYSAIVISIGACLGMLAFLILGSLFADYTALFLLKKGLSIGFHYASLWAGGIAMVAATIRTRTRLLVE